MAEPAFLDALMSQPLHVLTMDMRRHAIFAGKAGPVVAKAITDGGHRCHCCNVWLPDGMEIDHLDQNHANSAASNIKPICQVCHYGRHPIWAAQHHRIRLIWAPQLSQVELNRLFWASTLLADASDVIEGGAPRGLFDILKGNEALCSALAGAIPGLGGGDALEGVSLAITSIINDILDDVETREMHCARILGSANPESFVEAVFQVGDIIPPAEFAKNLDWLRQGLRYWPEQGTTAWSGGRIHDAGDEVINAAYAENGPLGLSSLSRIVARTAAAKTPEAAGDVSAG